MSKALDVIAHIIVWSILIPIIIPTAIIVAPFALIAWAISRVAEGTP